MACNCNRCAQRRSGAQNRSGRTRPAGTGRTGCAAPLTGTVAEELYGATRETPVLRNCYDDTCGCGQYYQSRRDPFWPSFCHPRWLRCNQLYCRRR